MRNILKKLSLMVLPLAVVACSSFFEKDNTPPPRKLVQFSPEITPRLLWSTRASSGSGDEYLKLQPAISENAIYTTSLNGVITSIDRATGRTNWRTNTGLTLTSGAGVGDGIVAAGSRQGEVVAVQQSTGKQLWQASVPGEIIAAPAIADGIVVIKAVDGNVRGLDVRNGEKRWSYQETEPNLILRAASTPRVTDGHVLIGFANGGLSKFRLSEGQLLWAQSIATPRGAFAVQRMIDIDADPIVYDHHIYAATYQGRIASLDWGSGRILWSHDISSYTGMTANADNVFISDADSNLWAFNANSGLVNWRQTDLEYRTISGPAVMDNYVVVGDAKGYVHWLSLRDGHFAARLYQGGAIYAAPIVRNGIAYVLSNNGNLSAYTMRS